ncbi:hypothetical protein F8388_005189 [Cannabis sativa]|uniref:Uncharacterized protein n=1 Tax=Cannabis sativa TaxID=3483 RepID=A0A7J6ECD0_CANSA|nr:hypothetical protein F8388_005189 [Cannabis sativa]KAF4400644.1 hypothetical protein G4B88_023052 [Cannabis sativa]
MDHFGEHMELLKLFKFKLQLGTLISEFREVRERERSATEHLHHRIQKQKQNEEDFARKIQELQAELSSSNEHRQKLERKVNYLQNDNVLLENKQKELQETIHNLSQSKECFVNAYEESTCDMKRAIQIRDRKLGVLSEKVKSHLLLFDSIEKEAVSVKQVVDNVQHMMMADLNNKLDKVSAFEKVFVERIVDLEEKLKCEEYEIQRKNRVISELEAQVEAAKALHSELQSLGIVIKSIQGNLKNINEETADATEMIRKRNICADSSLSPKSVGTHLLESISADSCVSKSASSEPQSVINAPCISANEENVGEKPFFPTLAT